MGYSARAAVLLITVVSLFFVAKWALGPGYLGLFDPDRTQNVAEWASKPLQYMETEECSSCHEDRIEKLQGASHQSLICEACHGPATEHVSSGKSLAIEHPEELCERCHTKLPSRPASQPQVDVEEHVSGLACIACHDPHSPRLTGTPTVPHSLEGRTECTVCHGAMGVKPFPQDHSGRTKETCLTCHESPETPGAGSIEPGGPPQVPHSLEGRADCLVCHESGGLKPFPENHVGRTSETCLACHEAAAVPSPAPTAAVEVSDDSSGPPQVPHSLEGRADCLVCHASGGFKPFPENHAGRTSETCLACHQQ